MQPVNYCAHIIEQTATQLGENPDNLVMRNIAAGLQRAQKFLLPDCAAFRIRWSHLKSHGSTQTTATSRAEYTQHPPRQSAW